MRTSKRYTNTTFTKRVDHAGRPPLKPAEPAVCKQCGAVYRHQRWSESVLEPAACADVRWHPSVRILCPACKQIEEGVPAGFVYLDGNFLAEHGEDLQRLLRNEAKRAEEDNPLARILKIDNRDSERLTVETTTEHLAQRLGHALEKAYGGDVHYGFSHENKIARVWWHRD